ncbi:hypothetical protein SAMN05216552_1001146 [Pseudoduganella namucuonensis]|uniref:Tir chaperone protein (CesT) family protein n=2 Tax=Pseudoduganella namucuonensis TaxID=1035707 RepID=A0A1I7EV41_9BURK|nr:hypothetical protein SAMN05216552_1001146 [Pseudoduganella namucuonensis]
MARLTGLLRELVELTGEEAGAVPVLELRFEDIVTRTSVLASDGNYLLITALLPPCGDAGYVAQSSGAVSLQAAQGMEYLWHADQGRHVGMRTVPVAALPDEPSVMDAILTTSDRAAAWFSSRRGHEPAA